jgi:cob(I)alamin adenosyltransferase
LVKLNKIYTRTGDKGSAGLVDGSRVSKSSLRMTAIGEVDEANAAIGVAIAALDEGPISGQLREIQNDLFDLGADLCTPESAKGKGPGGARLAVTDAQVTRLEQEIDALNGELSPLRSFILPGGTPAAAYLHLARTVCRRAERLIVELADQPGEVVSAAAIKYINRLSDFLFVASRFLNRKGTADVLWVPGQNR